MVVASDDPTPKAAGRGLGILRDEGVAVATVDGEEAMAARLLNQPFRKHARTGRPLVIFKSAMTLDGKVATASGDSQWISGESSRAPRTAGAPSRTRWRSAYTATTTIRSDLAREGVARQPARVVFDSEASLPLTSRLAHERP